MQKGGEKSLALFVSLCKQNKNGSAYKRGNMCLFVSIEKGLDKFKKMW